MSIHCLICEHQDNWRDDGEVEVDDNTWVVVKIFSDPDISKTKLKPIEEWWVHRDCIQHWLQEDIGVETKINYEPKRLNYDKT